MQAEARRDMNWEDLQREIAAGRPVIVWIIGEMWEGNPMGYTSPDGHKTVVAPYEHTMIVIGYEPGKVHVVDAYTGRTRSYPLRRFYAILENAWTYGDYRRSAFAIRDAGSHSRSGGFPSLPVFTCPL